jgi:hypothetical protein
VSAIGRNQPCRCGSEKKTKRCCGVPHGPSDNGLSRAYLANAASAATGRLLRFSPEELQEFHDAMLELPDEHLSLQLSLPELLPPELEALRFALDDDPEAADENVETAGFECVDSPQQRAGLARALLDLADAGIIDPDVAAMAIIDMSSYRFSAFVRSSLLHALHGYGDASTPSGSLVVSR